MSIEYEIIRGTIEKILTKYCERDENGIPSTVLKVHDFESDIPLISGKHFDYSYLTADICPVTREEVGFALK